MAVDVQSRVTAADALLLVMAEAVRRLVATVADRRMVVDRTAAEADRTVEVVADMGGKVRWIVSQRSKQHSNTLPSSETRKPRVPLLFFCQD
jgi:hypothetical protein